uniref:Cullin domain-containing protein n=1 Tax=Steinernema glaseri TaxID=37863 RepID=A0A1I8AF66_9BILA
MNANLVFTVDGAFDVIKDKFGKVFRSEEITPTEYVSLYWKTCEFCKSGTDGSANGGLMYEALIRFLRQFISEKAAQIGALTTPVDRLLEYKSAWEKFKKSAEATHACFKYVNAHWVKPAAENGKWKLVDEENKDIAKLYEVKALCLVIWMEEMFKKMPGVIIQSALAVLKEGEDGVEGARVDLVKVVTDSLVNISTQKDAKEDEVNDVFLDEDTDEEEEDELPEDPRQLLLAFEKQFQ